MEGKKHKRPLHVELPVNVDAVSTSVVEGEEGKKRKRKKSTLVVEDTVDVPIQVEENTEKVKKKKKKRQTEEHQSGQNEGETEEVVVPFKKKKKRKAAEIDDAMSEAEIVEEAVVKKKRKGKGTDDDEVATKELQSVSAPKEKKKKKRQVMDGNPSKGEDAVSKMESIPEPKEKKKKKLKSFDEDIASHSEQGVMVLKTVESISDPKEKKKKRTRHVSLPSMEVESEGGVLSTSNLDLDPLPELMKRPKKLLGSETGLINEKITSGKKKKTKKRKERVDDAEPEVEEERPRKRRKKVLQVETVNAELDDPKEVEGHDKEAVVTDTELQETKKRKKKEKHKNPDRKKSQPLVSLANSPPSIPPNSPSKSPSPLSPVLSILLSPVPSPTGQDVTPMKKKKKKTPKSTISLPQVEIVPEPEHHPNESEVPLTGTEKRKKKRRKSTVSLPQVEIEPEPKPEHHPNESEVPLLDRDKAQESPQKKKKRRRKSAISLLQPEPMQESQLLPLDEDRPDELPKKKKRKKKKLDSTSEGKILTVDQMVDPEVEDEGKGIEVPSKKLRRKKSALLEEGIKAKKLTQVDEGVEGLDNDKILDAVLEDAVNAVLMEDESPILRKLKRKRSGDKDSVSSDGDELKKSRKRKRKNVEDSAVVNDNDNPSHPNQDLSPMTSSIMLTTIPQEIVTSRKKSRRRQKRREADSLTKATTTPAASSFQSQIITTRDAATQTPFTFVCKVDKSTETAGGDISDDIHRWKARHNIEPSSVSEGKSTSVSTTTSRPASRSVTPNHIGFEASSDEEVDQLSSQTPRKTVSVSHPLTGKRRLPPVDDIPDEIFGNLLPGFNLDTGLKVDFGLDSDEETVRDKTPVPVSIFPTVEANSVEQVDASFTRLHNGILQKQLDHSPPNSNHDLPRAAHVPVTTEKEEQFVTPAATESFQEHSKRNYILSMPAEVDEEAVEALLRKWDSAVPNKQNDASPSSSSDDESTDEELEERRRVAKEKAIMLARNTKVVTVAEFTEFDKIAKKLEEEQKNQRKGLKELIGSLESGEEESDESNRFEKLRGSESEEDDEDDERNEEKRRAKAIKELMAQVHTRDESSDDEVLLQRLSSPINGEVDGSISTDMPEPEVSVGSPELMTLDQSSTSVPQVDNFDMSPVLNVDLPIQNHHPQPDPLPEISPSRDLSEAVVLEENSQFQLPQVESNDTIDPLDRSLIHKEKDCNIQDQDSGINSALRTSEEENIDNVEPHAETLSTSIQLEIENPSEINQKEGLSEQSPMQLMALNKPSPKSNIMSPSNPTEHRRSSRLALLASQLTSPAKENSSDLVIELQSVSDKSDAEKNAYSHSTEIPLIEDSSPIRPDTENLGYPVTSTPRDQVQDSEEETPKPLFFPQTQIVNLDESASEPDALPARMLSPIMFSQVDIQSSSPKTMSQPKSLPPSPSKQMSTRTLSNHPLQSQSQPSQRTTRQSARLQSQASSQMSQNSPLLPQRSSQRARPSLKQLASRVKANDIKFNLPHTTKTPAKELQGKDSSSDEDSE